MYFSKVMQDVFRQPYHYRYGACVTADAAICLSKVLIFGGVGGRSNYNCNPKSTQQTHVYLLFIH